MDDRGRIDFDGIARDPAPLERYVAFLAATGPTATPAAFRERADGLARRRSQALARAGEPARTRDGVAFADIGNVFAKVSGFSFTDLRESAGIGIRVRTPWFLLRGDYGFVLDHRPGERRSRFYFSIGQAF